MSQTVISFEELKSRYSKDNLFEDQDFPAVDKSIHSSQSYPTLKYVKWKRPPEFCSDPQFIVDGFSRFDLDQGSLGNCWFIAAAATLATRPQLLENVIPANQSFTKENYAGIFRFRFWRYGEWKEVIIDDRLPVRNDGKLEFCHNKEQPNEFWSSLLEKAYAKLHGSYELLLLGKMQDAMVDLTGGVSETINLKDGPLSDDDLFSSMKLYESWNSLMGCCLQVLGKGAGEQCDDGLIAGHSYAITLLDTVTKDGKTVRLIRLLNPWGRQEWKGSWSDGSDKWSGVSVETKTRLQLKVLEEGEFWMSFDEWRVTFTELQLCHLTIASLSKSKTEWLQKYAHGSWVRGVNAGGSGRSPNQKFYWDNPQYCVIVKESSGGSESSESDSSVIISLMKKEKREVGRSGSDITTGFRLFLIKRNEPVTLNNTVFPRETKIIEKGLYIPQYREVAHHYKIDAGIYCIIPTTDKKDEEAEYYLRVLAHQQLELKEMITDASAGAPMMSMMMARSVVLLNPTLEGSAPIDQEPLITPVKVKGLGQSPTTSGAAGHDRTDGSVFNKALTPAEREVLEAYESCIANDQSSNIDVNLLRRILSKLNEIGQLGCYKIQFSETNSKVFFYLLDSWRERDVTFEQIKILVNIIKEWVREFAIHDRDCCEFLPFRELWKVMCSLGFHLDNGTKEVITISYGSNMEGLYVTEFVNCTAKIYATSAFWATKSRNDTMGNISYQEMLQRVLMT